MIFSVLSSLCHHFANFVNAHFHFYYWQVFEVTDKLMVGLTGLASDVLTLDHTLKMHCNLYKLKENREIKPETFSALLSTLLYEKRYVIKESDVIIVGYFIDYFSILSLLKFYPFSIIIILLTLISMYSIRNLITFVNRCFFYEYYYRDLF